MTASQRQWLIDNGYNPVEWDITPDGQLVEQPKPEKISPLKAFGANFAKSVLPSAAALAAAGEGATIGSAGGLPGAVLGGIIGGLAGGGATGFVQDKALDAINPEINKYVAESSRQNPVSGYLGGFAPNAIALKPDLKGLRGLTQPLMGMRLGREFGDAAVNVGANVAGSTAQQLVDLAQGGEFDGKRFAADVALGSLFNAPTKVGKRLGLTAQQEPVKIAPDAPALEAAMRDSASRHALDTLKPGEGVVEKEPAAAEAPWPESTGKVADPAEYGDWWKNETAKTTDIIKDIAEANKIKIGKERLAEIANEPYAAEIMAGDYSKWPEFINQQAEHALEASFAEAQRTAKSGLLSAQEAAAQRDAMRYNELADIINENKPPTYDKPSGILSAEDAAIQQRTQPAIAEAQRRLAGLRDAEAQAKAAADAADRDALASNMAAGRELAAKRRAEYEAAVKAREDYEAQQASMRQEQRSADYYANREAQEQAAARERELAQYGPTPEAMRQGEALLPQGPKPFSEGAPKPKYPKAVGKTIDEKLTDLSSLLKEYAFRRQSGGTGDALTPEAFARFKEIAAQRGIDVEVGALSGMNGQWLSVDGRPIIQIDPARANLTTLAEEIGHDVFNRTASGRMQKSLGEAGLESPRYKSEREALLREREAGENKYSDAEIEAIAREEGVIDAYAKQFPTVSRAEISSWWKAFRASVKSMVGMKLSPQDAMSWLHYATHEGTPWTRAKVTAATQRPDEVRKQRALAQLEEQSPIHGEVARALKAQMETADYRAGQWRTLSDREIRALNPQQQEALSRHLANEYDTGVVRQPAPDLADAYRAVRAHIARVPQDYNAAGFGIRMANGNFRARGIDPTYAPLHVVSDDVKAIFGDPSRIGERPQRMAEFIDFTRDWYLRNHQGATPQAAEEYAQRQLQQEIGVMNGSVDLGDLAFSGARRPQGAPLPPTWRSHDLAKIMETYTRRSAIDFALQQHVESNPVVMAALGQKTHANGAPIPPAILQQYGGFNLQREPLVQTILKNVAGVPVVSGDSVTAGASRLVSAATLGTISRAKDVVGTMFKGLSYLPASEYAAGAAQFAQRLADWGATAERSYASGLNRRDGAAQLRAVLGTTDMVTNRLTQAADLIARAQGLDRLEQGARTIAQAWGETVIDIHRARALNGDAASLRFLDQLSPDWRTRDVQDLAAQVGRLLQGTYDVRSLPKWAVDSAAAPYLVWSKWSIGQYNNFMDYAIRPLMAGDPGPLIGQMLIGVLGGSAVEAVSEWLNNRQGKDINWSELSSWLNDNEADANVGQVVAQKLFNTAQNIGTFGYAGDLVRMGLDAASGSSVQEPWHMPVEGVLTDTVTRARAAMKALDDGEDFGRVLKQLVIDTARTNVQAARTAVNWLDEDEKMAYEDKRRKRLFDVLSGTPVSNAAYAVSYSNLSERDFDRADAASEDIVEQAGDLITRAAENATDMEDFKSRVRKLGMSQNGVMPNPQSQPAKALRYLNWLEGAEEGLGSDTQRRYQEAEAQREYKKRMIEQLALGR